MYLYGFVLFTAASAACGLAPSLPVLIARPGGPGRRGGHAAGQQRGAGGHERPGRAARAALGVQAAAQALGLALGPVAGGLLVASVGWRWIFFINVPVGIAAVAAGWFLLPRTRQRADRQATDPFGVVLLAVAATGTLVAVSALSGLGLPGPGLAAFAVPRLLAGAGLVWWERRTATPLVDLPMLVASGIAPLLAGALCAYLVLFGPLVLFPQVLTAHGGSVVQAGLPLSRCPRGSAWPRWPPSGSCPPAGRTGTAASPAASLPPAAPPRWRSRCPVL